MIRQDHIRPSNAAACQRGKSGREAIKRALLALCCVFWAVSCYAQTAAIRPSLLGAGLTSNPAVYNQGNQVPIPDQPINLQFWISPVSASCTINSTCVAGSTNDSARMIVATVSGITITAPAPGAVGSAGYSTGLDPRTATNYNLTTPAGVIYGCGPAAATISLTADAAISSDGTNWKCTPSGGAAAGGGGLNGMLPGQTPVAGTATTVTSSMFFSYYLAGFIPSNDATATVIDVSAGVAADSTNVLYITAPAFKKTLSATVFSAGNGPTFQCHDTAVALSAKMYALFVISNASGSNVDYLCAESVSSPVLPSGFTLSRFVGWVPSDGTNIRKFQTLDGHLYTWQVATYQTSTATTAQTLVTLDVPLGINVIPLCRVSMSNAAAASLQIYNPYVTDAAPTAPATVPFTVAPGWDIDQFGTTPAGDINAACPAGLVTNTSGQIATHASATATSVNFVTKGWYQ